MKAILSYLLALFLGICLGFIVITYFPTILLSVRAFFDKSQTHSKPAQKQIIGFLPYWLVGKAKNDYANSITTLTYFGLTIGTDGHIQYLANEQEEQPNWHTLRSNKLQSLLNKTKKNNQTLSLLVFSGNADAINELISNPVSHGKHLVQDVTPIMQKYDFSDLNLDIESTKLSSNEARLNFTQFVKTVKKEMDKKGLGTLTVEITGSDLIKNTLINPKDIAPIADYIVIMAYDFHYQGSSVAGPVAPIGGGGENYEFDTNIVLNQAYTTIPRNKIILGMPTYGYSWETLTDSPQSATLPGSGITMSNAATEEFLKKCASCSALLDKKAQENYIIYKDNETGTYHQIFYPNKDTMQKKVDLVEQNNLAGAAIWALGYENPSVLDPLGKYKTDIVNLTRL